MQGIERSDEIFADAAAHQFAVKLHVFDPSDDHDLGRWIANLGQAVDLVDSRLALQSRFDNQEIWRDLPGVMIDRRLQAAKLNGDVRLGKPSIGGRALNRGPRVRKFAKCMDGYW